MDEFYVELNDATDAKYQWCDVAFNNVEITVASIQETITPIRPNILILTNSPKNNNPVNSLGVPIGVRADGELFTLDLHEKFHGPHGLIAGMTGSGKSEFIITYILSMCLNFNPDEVSFVLIDYKGGGLVHLKIRFLELDFHI